jgi:hypothetical protein
VKSLFSALRAELCFERDCVKRFLPPAAAIHYFERHIIFEISRREISKMMCLLKDYWARSAVKRLFTQPLSEEYSAAEGGKRLFTQRPRPQYKVSPLF